MLYLHSFLHSAQSTSIVIALSVLFIRKQPHRNHVESHMIICIHDVSTVIIYTIDAVVTRNTVCSTPQHDFDWTHVLKSQYICHSRQKPAGEW